MWALVEPLLIKFAIEEILEILIRAGVISETTASLVRTAEDLREAVSGVRFYREYPGDLAGPTNEHSFTAGEKPPQ